MADIVTPRVYAGGRPKGALAKAPRKPKLVLRIIRLKDQENMDFRSIGRELGTSAMAPCLLYNRWRDWAYENDLIKKEPDEELDGAA